MPEEHHAEAQRRRGARCTLAVLAFLGIAGLTLGWNKGKHPHRLPAAGAGTDAVEATAADLALYREMIISVRGGANYYDAAREALPRYGFPISSPLNWRLPTYAWVFSWLPNKCWIQAVLLLLAIGGMWLAFVAERQQSSVVQAGLTAFLLFGVVRWTFDGEAYLAQEVWAAVLMIISISAHWLGTELKAWRAVSIVAGLAALFFRELALPYCGMACLLAAWNRRWLESAAWAIGIVAFGAFLVWHVGQVQAQLAGTEIAASAGLSQWLRFGGLDFVLLTTRMNSLLFAAPAMLMWLFLLASLVGLSRREGESGQLACLAALAYLVAFAFVGRPENFYWGLMAAPLLPWGFAHAHGVIGQLWTEAELSRSLHPDPERR